VFRAARVADETPVDRGDVFPHRGLLRADFLVHLPNELSMEPRETAELSVIVPDHVVRTLLASRSIRYVAHAANINTQRRTTA